jgi:hypothetical protein
MGIGEKLECKNKKPGEFVVVQRTLLSNIHTASQWAFLSTVHKVFSAHGFASQYTEHRMSYAAVASIPINYSTLASLADHLLSGQFILLSGLFIMLLHLHGKKHLSCEQV